jgi:hypothetical protein
MLAIFAVGFLGMGFSLRKQRHEGAAINHDAGFIAA